ncbi:hypothetical protein [Actomonas aquatica]|uniref:Uncharacterized protein n=1 Tax=Actomonas aquatica TaxID=2866162 RepID=A0ABZ1CAS8_9BACT|nr:hypothetical protein [Opitutus sp. WL0086]WRQ88799.1 hypothetical protein K1X11_005240 [Opitutus sp. WL0086]
MDTPPPPPPSTADTKPIVQHVVVSQPKADAIWGRPIFRAPELKSFTPRKKEGYFPQKPFKGRVRDKRAG